MRPIPLSWLIHSAALYAPQQDDYGNATDGEPVPLERVRFEPSSRMTIDKSGRQSQCALTLFWDVRNSLPRDVLPAVGQIVKWEGLRYRVKLVEKLYDRRKLHHYEIGLEEAEA